MSDNTRINISSYHNSSSRNYGVNSMLVMIGNLDFYFSYQTVVAFCSPESGLVVSENNWGPTTGKHLNAIQDNKKIRLSRDEFERQLNETLERYKLTTPRIDI